MNKTRDQGQGLVEFIIASAVLTYLLTHALLLLNDKLVKQHKYLDEMRALLFQPLPQQAWQVHQGDVFTRGVEPIIGNFNNWVDLDFPLHNLHRVTHKQSPFVLARLTDDWQISSAEQLAFRPAQLTATRHLKDLGMDTVLGVIGYIPIAKELQPEQLQLGKVDTEATPIEVGCGEDECH